MRQDTDFDRDLPEFISRAIRSNATSLGNNPAIPDIYDAPFLEEKMRRAYGVLSPLLDGMGGRSRLRETLADAIEECREIEAPYRNILERICVSRVIEMFNVPEDSVDIEVSLSSPEHDGSRDSVDVGLPDRYRRKVSLIRTDKSKIAAYVMKRRFLEALITGGSMLLSMSRICEDDAIDDIDTRLIPLYKKIVLLNYILMLSSEPPENSECGFSTVFIGDSDRNVRITACGEIFPVLLYEAVRGFMELFISHGLPESREAAAAVLFKEEPRMAEVWEMRLGPVLWRIFESAFNDMEIHDLPYLLESVSSLSVEFFNFAMKEVMAGTKRGRLIMSRLCSKAKKSAEYNKFVDRMDVRRDDIGMITDEFIKEKE